MKFTDKKELKLIIDEFNHLKIKIYEKIEDEDCDARHLAIMIKDFAVSYAKDPAEWLKIKGFEKDENPFVFCIKKLKDGSFRAYSVDTRDHDEMSYLRENENIKVFNFSERSKFDDECDRLGINTMLHKSTAISVVQNAVMSFYNRTALSRENVSKHDIFREMKSIAESLN